MKHRFFQTKNYKAIYDESTGVTMRFKFDNNRPMQKLDFPEILDISLGQACYGRCPYCYADAKTDGVFYSDCAAKITRWFGSMSDNDRPFQVAIGGEGEPTLHPEFISVLKAFKDLGITPNYTTNGMHLTDEILLATRRYCGGVAVSCHDHMPGHWIKAVRLLKEYGVNLSLHHLIGYKTHDIDAFFSIYESYKNDDITSVLLPYQPIGRGYETIEMQKAFDELIDRLTKISAKNVAFGALFYPYLKDRRDFCEAFGISIYEPEKLSGYVKMDTDEFIVRKSSFDPIEVTTTNNKGVSAWEQAKR